jgi:hypothetical protein
MSSASHLVECLSHSSIHLLSGSTVRARFLAKVASRWSDPLLSFVGSQENRALLATFRFCHLRPLTTRLPKHPPPTSLSYLNNCKHCRMHSLALQWIPSSLTHISTVRLKATRTFLADSVPSNRDYRGCLFCSCRSIGTLTVSLQVKACKACATRLMPSEVP